MVEADALLFIKMVEKSFWKTFKSKICLTNAHNLVNHVWNWTQPDKVFLVPLILTLHWK